MRKALFYICIIMTSLGSAGAMGQTPKAGKNDYMVRGQKQSVFFLPAADDSIHQAYKVIFMPGDGGWRGFAITIADSMASWGYDVFGFDTRHYLSSFTRGAGLNEMEVMSDLRQIARWINPVDSQRVILSGWSEGAGLCLLGAASAQNRDMFRGLLTIGLPDSSVLGWRFIDNLTYLTKKNPDEKMFASVDYLPQVSPLPIFMIQSTNDEYVSTETARRLFTVASEPNKFTVVDAENHHFQGNREDFFNALRQGLEWISQTPH